MSSLEISFVEFVAKCNLCQVLEMYQITQTILNRPELVAKFALFILYWWFRTSLYLDKRHNS